LLVAALVAALAAVLAACDVRVPSSLLPSGTIRPAPTFSLPSFPPDETEAPTDEPEPTLTGPTLEPGSVVLDGPFPPGTAVRVTVGGLAVRSEPRPRAPALAELQQGDVLALLGWPRRIDGRTWYEALRAGTGGKLPPLPSEFGGGERVGGWVVVRDGRATVRGVAPRCPDEVTLAVVGAMLASERLACFGSDSITLTGTSGCGECGGASTDVARPEWLIGEFSAELLSVDPRLRLGDLSMRFSPDGPERPAAGSVVDVTGHFDDPAAADCRLEVTVRNTLLPVARSLAVEACRQQFVVERYQVIGSDPDFPAS
jgi:hypothetical protein